MFNLDSRFAIQPASAVFFSEGDHVIKCSPVKSHSTKKKYSFAVFPTMTGFPTEKLDNQQV